MKKINFKFKYSEFKNALNAKIAIFASSALFFLYLLYLSIPSLYDTGRVQKVISNKLLKDFDLNFSLSTDITYRMLPQPHFSIKDSKLFNVKSNFSHDIAEIKELKVFIRQNNFFNKKNIEIKKINIIKANFFFKRDDFDFINSFLIKKFSKKKIKIKKSKFFFNDVNDNIVFIYTANNANFFKLVDDEVNIFSSKGEIFNIPVNLEWNKNLTNQNTVFKINTKKIFLDVLNKSFFNNGKYKYENVISIASNKFRTNYEIKKNSVIINSKKSIIKNIPISYDGVINFKPFSFKLDVNAKEVNFLYLLKNTFLLNEIILSRTLSKKTLNGIINIKSDKIVKNKIFNNMYLKVNFDEGEINLDNSILISNKIGVLKIYDSGFIEKDQKIFFEGRLKFNVSKIKNFYKTLLIPKKVRKNFEAIEVNVSFDLTNGDTAVNNIIFYSNNGKRINSEKIDQAVEDNIEYKYNYSNFISFKNFLKKIAYIYSQEG